MISAFFWYKWLGSMDRMRRNVVMERVELKSGPGSSLARAKESIPSYIEN